MACVIKMKSPVFVSKRLSEKFGKLWLAAEVMLFVLVGAAVDIRYTLSAGLSAVLMIFVALLFRSMGVLLCVAATRLTWKERLFCVIAYLPKAMLMYGKEVSNRKQEVDRQHHTIPKQKPNDRIVESLFPCIF